MISSWMIYFIGVVDSICFACKSCSVFAIMCFCVCAIGAGVNSSMHFESEKRLFQAFKVWTKRFLYTAVMLLTLGTLVPNGKTLAAMYVIPTIANNEKVQSIGKNGLDLLDELTTQWLKELKGKERKQSTSEDI